MTVSIEERSWLVDRRVLGQRQRDRRHDVRPRHPVLGDQAEELVEVEPRHRHDRRPGPQALVHDHRLPVDVEEGQDPDQDVVLGDREPVLHLDQVRDQVASGSASRPWAARSCRSSRAGPRGRSPASISTSGAAAGSPSRSVNGAAPSASPTTKTSSDAGRRGRLAGDVQERRHRQQDLRLRVVQLVLELARRVERVGGRRATARARDAVERDRVLREVRHVDGERVARPEAARGEPRRECARRTVELRVRDRPTARAVDQRRLVAQLLRALEHERGHVPVGELHRGETNPSAAAGTPPGRGSSHASPRSAPRGTRGDRRRR